jgi:hypothetical protein
MTSQEIEGLRIALLQALAIVAGVELPLPTLVTAAKRAGFRDVEVRTVAAEMSYLEDKQLVVAGDKTLSPENREWRIAAEGRDFLAKRGL